MTTHQMTIRLKGLTTEQLKTWLDMVTENAENVTHWEAKAENPNTRTSRTFDGTLVVTSEEDPAGTPNTPGTYLNTGSLVEEEEVTELTDIPEPTFTDPDAKTVEVRDPVLPKSDHIPGKYSLDSWYEDEDPYPYQ